MKTEVKQYFNPDHHLTLHQDKEGNMIGGGYHVNNLLYQHKMPLFVSLDEAERQHGGGGGGSGGGGGGGDDHFIPEKFSDLFRDLAVPAGLFMMPALFRPRNYAFEVPEEATEEAKKKTHDDTDTDDSESDDEHSKTKTVPNDIFDTLLSLVTPSERIHHDIKTRRQRHAGGKDKKRQNKTKRSKA